MSAADALADVVVGADGRARCPWGAEPGLREYHDTEWGRELRGDQAMFERLSLEAFQSGLSWAIILAKREAFRRAFADFDPERVAAFGEADVQRLLADAGIVRNRAKIEATIGNARTTVDLDEPLSDLLWSYAPVRSGRPRSTSDVPSSTAESTDLARGLKRRGFRFVGATTAYALMQAVGMVDDHLAGCHVRGTGSGIGTG